MWTSEVVAGATVVFVVACSAGDHARPSVDVGAGGRTAMSDSSGSSSSDAGDTPSGGGTTIGGSAGTGGTVAAGGLAGTGGTIAPPGGSVATGGFEATGGSIATGGAPGPGTGETGRLVGMTDAHNLVRASIATSPPIPNLTWSTTIAAVAQTYADQLASSGCNLVHSGTAGYGENLAQFTGNAATPADVVSSWAGESACYTYGLFMKTDSCTCPSSGCGHYTQVVWRTTTEVGCGVAVCPGLQYAEIWVCNYSPPGNYIGVAPY